MKRSFPNIYFGLPWLCLAWGLLGGARLLGESSPALLPLQFRVADSNGLPVADGLRTVTFRIYTNAVEGAASWVETHRDVGVCQRSIQNVPLRVDSKCTTPAGIV